MTQSKFIVIEGLNGVGKTSISRSLVDQLGGAYFTTPSSMFGASRPQIDKEADLMSRFLFYLAGVYQSSISIGEVVRSGKHVVCDRYVFSTVCSHRALGLNVRVPGFVNFLQPDFGFLITCEQDVRIVRMEARGMGINDFRERNDRVEDLTMREFRKCPLIEIDNTSNGVEIAVARIMGMIGE